MVKVGFPLVPNLNLIVTSIDRLMGLLIIFFGPLLEVRFIIIQLISISMYI